MDLEIIIRGRVRQREKDKYHIILLNCGIYKNDTGTSLGVQWLRLQALNAGGQDLVPGQGTRFHMPQLRIPHAATKTRCSQIHK